ncbi:hypothetical protein Q5H93_10495 [Hymenobacter sp. ASUV-10]|uniref:Uncharacterized protein n=1 Tax=Hymenobacter aranciens TaxID=3063996 RepID=A0ABT9BA66_9BACT|nr:hypothetical protein [Hymenobacter sp. ASUV-10]MDO7875161.1 hypothetical protein [Hymenobacter sp. ASUV-10]
MFNTILPYRRVQRNRNRTEGRESWQWLDIYKFFMHSPSSRRKYLVEIHAYDDHLYTADFYAKVHNLNRYRLRTNQQAAGKLGGTVLAILAEVIRHDPQACFGFIAAAMVDETSDRRTKRFELYTRMLELKLNPTRHVMVSRPENSSIFVLPAELASQPAVADSIIARYESIFAETF